MKLYINNNNWLIEDQLDEFLVEDLKNIVNKNLDNFLQIKEGYSTTGKNSEQYWIEKVTPYFYFDNLELQEIKKCYKNEVLKKLKESKLLHENVCDNLSLENKSCWTVLGEENSFHTAHCHNGGNYNGISTILYLNVPETNVENEPNNNVFLVMDSSPNNMWYNYNFQVISINPEIGKLLIFPEWIVHGTYPQTKGVRQTFNMDYYFANSTLLDFKYG